VSSYTYSGYLWPSFIAIVLIATLGLYAWRHRSVPGASPFAVGCLFAVAWSFGSMMQTAATTPDAMIFWLRFATVWQLPVVTAATCFMLQYAGLERWLDRRTLALLVTPPLLFVGLILTDPLHHLFWSSLVPTVGGIDATLGAAGVVMLAYSYVLSLFNVGVLVWLFVRSPRHRRPVAILLAGQIGARVLYQFGVVQLGFPMQWDPDSLVLLILFSLYAVALFRFHVFDPLPAARATALEQMQEAMVVVDLQRRIVDANAAAERTLGEPAASFRGRSLDAVLPDPVVSLFAEDAETTAEVELVLGYEGRPRYYVADRMPLNDRYGCVGGLLLLHDVTEQRRAQARLLEQERVVATLQERERLAREIHDSVGQVLGYVSMQAQTIRTRLGGGDGLEADALLVRLADVAQRSHADIRESILALRSASSNDWAFLPALRRYMQDFEAEYGVRTELLVADGVTEEVFRPESGVQLLRVVQEALTNARKHAGASLVSIRMERTDERARVVVTDDGCGFEVDRARTDGERHFGLAFMRERMAQIDGSIAIDSTPGAGTSVLLEVPIHDEQEARG
jgi:PAS domain S-box-containing protein